MIRMLYMQLASGHCDQVQKYEANICSRRYPSRTNVLGVPIEKVVIPKICVNVKVVNLNLGLEFSGWEIKT